MEQHVDPVEVVKEAAKNSPWIVISIMIHVVVIAVISVVYVHHQLTKEDTSITTVGIANTKKDEKLEDLLPPEVIDRAALPKFQDSEVAPMDVDIFIPTGEVLANKEEDLEKGDQTVDPTAQPSDLTNLPSGGTTGGTAIGAGEGPGHHGIAPSAFGGWKLGGGGKFGSRFGKGKEKALRSGGSTVAESVEKGLRWLKNHQDEDGRWDAANFMKHDKEGTPCDGPGNPVNDVGITALALLAFLGDGSTMKVGVHKEVVRKAVKWLLQQQGEDGLFGTTSSHEHIYSHAIATLAMCEAYGLSDYKALRAPAQKGIDYIQAVRNPYKVWRYFPRDGDNDTSVTGWMVLALKSAEEFKLKIDTDALKAAELWFDSVTDPSTGVAGYTRKGEGSSRKESMQTKFPSSKTECMTAVALISRVFLGQDPKKYPVMEAAANTMLKKPPVWNEADGSIDMYYWYYGSLAMFQMGGNHWTQWSQKMKDAILKQQRNDANFLGSWDPKDPWGEDGGRVYSTAIMVLCLEVYFRYGRVLGAR
jgi:hypothetical protein